MNIDFSEPKSLETKLIYVCSPLSGTPDKMKSNIEKAESYCQMMITQL